MNSDLHYSRQQYELVLESRTSLLDYCKTISPPDFLSTNSSFGRGGTIRNLLVHIANTYEFWIGKNALKMNVVFTKYKSVNKVEEVIALFSRADILLFEFIEKVAESRIQLVEYEINGNKSVVEPLKLFTHVITHEFHHKGQILSMSRHLGYTPVDTDIIK